MSVWQKISAWFARKGGFAHVVAAFYLSVVGLYATVPAFAQLLNSIYTATPAWSHETILAALGVATWYKNNSK